MGATTAAGANRHVTSHTQAVWTSPLSGWKSCDAQKIIRGARVG